MNALPPCQYCGKSVLCFSESQVHAHIISYLKQEMPSVFRKDNKKKNLIYQLPVIFSKIQLQHNISAGDFPDCAKMQVCLSAFTTGHIWEGTVERILCNIF